MEARDGWHAGGCLSHETLDYSLTISLFWLLFIWGCSELSVHISLWTLSQPLLLDLSTNFRISDDRKFEINFIVLLSHQLT